MGRRYLILALKPYYLELQALPFTLCQFRPYMKAATIVWSPMELAV